MVSSSHASSFSFSHACASAARGLRPLRSTWRRCWISQTTNSVSLGGLLQLPAAYICSGICIRAHTHVCVCARQCKCVVGETDGRAEREGGREGGRCFGFPPALSDVRSKQGCSSHHRCPSRHARVIPSHLRLRGSCGIGFCKKKLARKPLGVPMHAPAWRTSVGETGAGEEEMGQRHWQLMAARGEMG